MKESPEAEARVLLLERESDYIWSSEEGVERVGEP